MGSDYTYCSPISVFHPQFKPPHSKPHLLLFSKPAISHHFSIICQTYNEGSPFVATSCID